MALVVAGIVGGVLSGLIFKNFRSMRGTIRSLAADALEPRVTRYE
jgi:hypothetical protein